jgi:hypothetical protein
VSVNPKQACPGSKRMEKQLFPVEGKDWIRVISKAMPSTNKRVMGILFGGAYTSSFGKAF